MQPYFARCHSDEIRPIENLSYCIAAWVEQVGVMLGAVVLWVFGDMLGISSVLTAMIGLCALLITGVLEWKDCLQETSAWDTLLWFAGSLCLPVWLCYQAPQLCLGRESDTEQLTNKSCCCSACWYV